MSCRHQDVAKRDNVERLLRDELHPQQPLHGRNYAVQYRQSLIPARTRARASTTANRASRSPS